MVEILNNYIDGSFVEPQNKQYLDVYEPATGLIYGRVAESGAKDIIQAVDSAKKAFPKWSSLPIEERANYLKKIGYNIEYSNLNELKKIIKVFQMRFRPELINGKLDLECFNIAKSLYNLK